jgi:hypothetical protein
MLAPDWDRLAQKQTQLLKGPINSSGVAFPGHLLDNVLTFDFAVSPLAEFAFASL